MHYTNVDSGLSTFFWVTRHGSGYTRLPQGGGALIPSLNVLQVRIVLEILEVYSRSILLIYLKRVKQVRPCSVRSLTPRARGATIAKMMTVRSQHAVISPLWDVYLLAVGVGIHPLPRRRVCFFRLGMLVRPG